MTAPGRFPDPLLAAEQQDGVVFLLRVDGAGDGCHQPFAEASLPIVRAVGGDCGRQEGNMVRRPVPRRKTVEIGRKRVVFLAVIGMDYSMELRQFTTYPCHLHRAPDGVLPVVGDRYEVFPALPFRLLPFD